MKKIMFILGYISIDEISKKGQEYIDFQDKRKKNETEKLEARYKKEAIVDFLQKLLF